MPSENDEKRPIMYACLRARGPWSRGIAGGDTHPGYGDMSYDPEVKAGPDPHADHPMAEFDIQGVGLLPTLFPSRKEEKS